MPHTMYYYVAIIRRRPRAYCMATTKQYQGYRRIVMHVRLHFKKAKKKKKRQTMKFRNKKQGEIS